MLVKITFPNKILIVSHYYAGDSEVQNVASNRVRRDLTHLSERDVQSLKSALRELQLTSGPGGYQVRL